MKIRTALGALGAVALVAWVGLAIGEREGEGVAFGALEEQVPSPDDRLPEADAIPTDVLAARTVDRLLLFRTGNAASSMSLGSDEVTALLIESLPGLLPTGVVDAEVRLRGDGIVVTADVVADIWAGTSRLRPLLAVLPDTLRAEIDGRVARMGRTLVLRVTGARAHGVTLPGPVVDALVRELPMSTDRVEGPALQVALPDGIADVRLEGDRLVLYAAEPILERTVDGGADG